MNSREILSSKQILDLYGSKKDFTLSYTDIEGVKNMTSYIVNRFSLGGGKVQKKDAWASLLEYIGEKHRDSSVYLYLRVLRRENLGYTPSVRELVSIEEKAYYDTIIFKIDELEKTLGQQRVSMKGMSILDIGTEKLAFLDEFEKRTGKTAYGINISTGFCHYDECFDQNKNDPRFQEYDGMIIPHKDKQFDLITMYSVIHHIPTENLLPLVKEIARKCRGYLFFKDVNLDTDPSKAMCRIQHHLYEGVMMPGERSYLNDTVTRNKVLDTFKEGGFSVVQVEEKSNFNKSYYALLRVK